MTTVTVKVSNELGARLKRISERRRVSKSLIIREALEEALGKQECAESLSAYDLMKDGIGIVKSGCPDLATNPKYMEGFGK